MWVGVLFLFLDIIVGLASAQLAYVEYPDPITGTVGDFISVAPSILVGLPVFSSAWNLPAGLTVNSSDFVLSGTIQPFSSSTQTIANLTFTDGARIRACFCVPIACIHCFFLVDFLVHVPVRFNLYTAFLNSVSYPPILCVVNVQCIIDPIIIGKAPYRFSWEAAPEAGTTLDAATGVITILSAGHYTTLLMIALSYIEDLPYAQLIVQAAVRVIPSNGVALTVYYPPTVCTLGLQCVVMPDKNAATSVSYTPGSFDPLITLNSTSGFVSAAFTLAKAAVFYLVKFTASPVDAFWMYSVLPPPPLVRHGICRFTLNRFSECEPVQRTGAPFSTFSSSAPLPAGLSGSPTNCSILGTPTVSNVDQTFDITCSNIFSASVTRARIIITDFITLVEPPLTIQYDNTAIATNTMLVLNPVIAPANSVWPSPTTWSALHLPVGLTINTLTGRTGFHLFLLRKFINPFSPLSLQVSSQELLPLQARILCMFHSVIVSAYRNQPRSSSLSQPLVHH